MGRMDSATGPRSYTHLVGPLLGQLIGALALDAQGGGGQNEVALVQTLGP